MVARWWDGAELRRRVRLAAHVVLGAILSAPVALAADATCEGGPCIASSTAIELEETGGNSEALAHSREAFRWRFGLSVLAFRAEFFSGSANLFRALKPNSSGGFGHFVGAPAISAGVMFQQIPLEGASPPLLFQELFTLHGSKPLLGDDTGYALGGFMDLMVGTRWPKTLLTAAVGPSVGLIHVEMDRDVPRPDLSLLLGGAVTFSVDLDGLPGWSVQLTGRLGMLPNTGGTFTELVGDYAQAELALALGL
jgi:hypothetical protein